MTTGIEQKQNMSDNGQDEREDTSPIDVDIVIVGFGYACIPLLRELERTGEKFVVISPPGGGIWAQLEREGRLDFDLVSSKHSSYYSFDLVKDPYQKDTYPTAREFYDMHKGHYEMYQRHVIDDLVTGVDNHASYNYVHTRSGTTYKAAKVVMATGFGRSLHRVLKEFDCDQDNQTIVMTSIGDSANLLLAKLVPGKNNRVILLHDGFLSLSKQRNMRSFVATVDQFECHNVDFLSPTIYKDIMTGGLPQLGLSTDHLWVKCPETIRWSDILKERSGNGIAGIPNGRLAIKHWKIEEYARMFGNDLEDAISKGYLMNDITFFVSEKHVTSFPKRSTTIDRMKKTILTKDGMMINYDHLIEGNHEKPNLPPIRIHRDGREHLYSYIYRDNFLGVINPAMKNVFFLGLTRPLTGGLANITEMQCLLVHKMLTNASFNRRIYEEIPARIKAYDERYYGSQDLLKPGAQDHITSYGLYNKEVARVIGIDINFSDSRSLDDVNKWLLYPCSAVRFRERGEYQIEGASEVTQSIYTTHGRFAWLRGAIGYLLAWNFLYMCTLLTGVVVWLCPNGSPVVRLIVFCSCYASTAPFRTILFDSFYLNSLMDRSMWVFIVPMFIGTILGLWYNNILILLATFGYNAVMSYLLRQFGYVRYLFNDTKHHHKYRAFYNRYGKALTKVRTMPSKKEA